MALWFAHRWLGLTVGLYLAVVAATGGVLVFHDEIDAWSRPALVAPPTGHPSSPSDASLHPLTAVRGVLFARYGAQAAAGFTTFQFPRAPDRLYTTTGRVDGQTVTLAIDPARGQIVQATPRAASPLARVEDLHTNLLASGRGFVANGWASLAAAVLLMSGMVLYWPGGLFLRPGSKSLGSLSPHTRTRVPASLPVVPPSREAGTRVRVWGDREPRNLHTLLGIATLALLLVNTLTGAALVFNDPVERAVYRLTTTPPRPGPAVAPAVATSKVATLDTLLDAARSAAHDADPIFVTLPNRPQQAFYALLQKPVGILPYISVYIHPQTGDVLRVDRDDRAPVGRRIMGSVPALHEGTWGGLPVKIVYAAVAFVPLTLYITGGLMFVRRARKARRLRRG